MAVGEIVGKRDWMARVDQSHRLLCKKQVSDFGVELYCIGTRLFEPC